MSCLPHINSDQHAFGLATLPWLTKQDLGRGKQVPRPTTKGWCLSSPSPHSPGTETLVNVYNSTIVIHSFGLKDHLWSFDLLLLYY